MTIAVKTPGARRTCTACEGRWRTSLHDLCAVCDNLGVIQQDEDSALIARLAACQSPHSFVVALRHEAKLAIDAERLRRLDGQHADADLESQTGATLLAVAAALQLLLESQTLAPRRTT